MLFRVIRRQLGGLGYFAPIREQQHDSLESSRFHRVVMRFFRLHESFGTTWVQSTDGGGQTLARSEQWHPLVTLPSMALLREDQILHLAPY
jgi:hypothetical protein